MLTWSPNRYTIVVGGVEMINIKLARIKAGSTQQEVADILKVAKNTVSRWETGDRALTVENLVKLAELYKTTTDFLVGRE